VQAACEISRRRQNGFCVARVQIVCCQPDTVEYRHRQRRNWTAIPAPRVISGSICADVGAFIAQAETPWWQRKPLKGGIMGCDE
jgi:hypothetical protein